MALVSWLLVTLLAWAAPDDPPIEFPLSRFGSRATLDPCPQHRGLRLSATGRPTGDPEVARIGVSITEWIWALPFTDENVRVASVEQEFFPTGVRYVTRTPARTVELAATLRSPFYPGDVRLSTAPVFLLDVGIRNLGHRPRPCRFHLTLPFFPDEPDPVEHGNGVHFVRGAASDGSGDFVLAWDDDVEDLREEGARPLVFRSDLRVRQRRELRFVLAGYHGDPVVQIDDVPYRFRYTEFFGDEIEAAAWALEHRDDIARKSDLFDSIVVGTGIPDSMRNLASLAFQTFCGETLWCVNEEGGEWFGIGEPGRDPPLSDLRIVGPFLLETWPELYDRLVTDRIARAASDTALEAADRLVLLEELRRARGPDALTPEHRAVASRSVEVLLRSDTNGNGLPDAGALAPRGTPLPGPLTRPDSLVLGVRALVALRAAERLLATDSDSDTLRRIREAVDRIRDAMEFSAWNGAVYRVIPPPSPDRGADGSVDAMRLDDAGSPAILAPLLVLERWGDDAVLSPRDRVISDAETLEREQAEDWGPRLSRWRRDGSVSIGLARDLVSLASGGGSIDRLDRHWEAQVAKGSDPETTDPAGFRDLLGGGPSVPSVRGLIAFEVVKALAGVRSGERGLLGYRPSLDPMDAPVVAAADWGSKRIPRLVFETKGGELVTTIRHRRLLDSAAAVYRLGEEEHPREIRMVVAAGAPLRLLSGPVTLEEARVGDAGHAATILGEPGEPYRLRISGLPPGEFVARVDGIDQGRFDARELDAGILIPAAGPCAIPLCERARILRLRDRVESVEGRESAASVAASIQGVLRSIARRLDEDVDARRFRLEIRNVRGDEAPAEAPSPAEVSSGASPIRPLEEEVWDLFATSADSGEPGASETLFASIRPMEILYAVGRIEPDAPVTGAIEIRNHWFPPLEAELRILPGSNFSLDLPADSSPGPNGSVGVTARIARDTPARFPAAVSGGAGSLHATLPYDLRMRRGGIEQIARGELGVRDGSVREWLISRMHTEGESAFEQSEAAEWDGRPAPSGGEANWQRRSSDDGFIPMGRMLPHEEDYSAYAHTYVRAPVAGSAVLVGSAGGRLRIWLDGRRVFPVDAKAFEGGSFRVDVTLAAGWHRLLVKLEEGQDGFQAKLAITTDDPDLRRGLAAMAVPSR